MNQLWEFAKIAIHVIEEVAGITPMNAEAKLAAAVAKVEAFVDGAEQHAGAAWAVKPTNAAIEWAVEAALAEAKATGLL